MSNETKTWYGVHKHSSKIGPRQLKQEEKYESDIFVELQAAGIFDPTVHPGDLYNIMTKDLATAAIEDSLLSAEHLGHTQLEKFISQRFVVPDGEDKPAVAFSSTLTKVKAPTFANLYDVASEKGKKGAEPVSINRSILQRLVTAYEAKRPVNLKEVASHELMHIPISIFETSGKIRSGAKSTMVTQLTCDVGLQHTPLPPHTKESSTLIIDVMARVHAIQLPNKANNFGDLADVFVSSDCKVDISSTELKLSETGIVTHPSKTALVRDGVNRNFRVSENL